jgi:hypothetical protein
VPGKWGMRLEDIVVATEAGPVSMNVVNHELESVVGGANGQSIGKGFIVLLCHHVIRLQHPGQNVKGS